MYSCKKRKIAVFFTVFAISVGFLLTTGKAPDVLAAESRDTGQTKAGHTHTVCGHDICTGGSGHTGHEAVDWQPWSPEGSMVTSFPKDSGYYYLTSDIELSSSIAVAADIHLCLNGHSITTSGPTDGTYSSQLSIGEKTSSRSCTFTDCTETLHKFSVNSEKGIWVPDEAGGTETLAGGYLAQVNLRIENSTVDIYNIHITGNTDYAVKASCTDPEKPCTLFLHSGTFTGNVNGIRAENTAIYMYDSELRHQHLTAISCNSGCTFYMYGGKITENGDKGPASTPPVSLAMTGDSTGYMYGGEISDNNGTGLTVTGATSTFHMYDGEISRNKNLNMFAAGVHCYGTFIMEGGIIANNTSKLDAGGVHIEGGTLQMSGGTISGNATNATCRPGSYVIYPGGVYITSNGRMCMTGGEITGNNASSDLGIGGVAADASSSVSLGGTAIIKDNTAASATSNLSVLVLSSNGGLTDIVEPFTGNASVGFDVRYSPSGNPLLNLTGENDRDYSAYFHSDDASFPVLNGPLNQVQLSLMTAEMRAQLDDVIAKIDAIGTGYLFFTADCREKIEQARTSYDALTDALKKEIPADKLQLLADAEKVYDVLSKIHAIGTVEKTDVCALNIAAARTAYDALTDAAKKRIPGTEYTVLTNAEAAYAKLQSDQNTQGDGNSGNGPADTPGSGSGSSSGGNDDSSSGGSGTDTPADSSSKQIRTIRKELGVSEKTAKKILSMAEKQKVPMDTILVTDKKITSQKTHKDIKGSSFAAIQAQAAKAEKTSIRLAWNKVKNADGYIIYGAKCKNGTKFKTLKTVKKGTTSFTHKKLSKGTYYRYIVRAYKLVDGKKVTIAASKTICETTGGGKRGNIKSLKLNRTSLSLKKGKTFTLKATEKKESKPISRHRKVSYESGNPSVASVTAKGVVKAKKKGKCTIYVYAQNGVYKKITVNVK